MSGSIDSTMFASRKFINLQTFTYRKVDALRLRSTLTQQWHAGSKTTASIVYRDNAIGQNPAYRVKNDHRKVNGTWIGKKDLAHGEINDNSFNSYALIAQHRQEFNWKNAVITSGASIDLSPSAYRSHYIRINRDTVNNKYTGYQATDSTLSSYSTHINNYAVFGNFEFTPAESWRVVASLRYDLFRYDFNNHLAPSSFSGSADTLNTFRKWSSKIGFTYNISKTTGFYANYSQGFVPPQLTEMYTGVKVPELKPAVFHNYEIGGWASLIPNRLSVDASIYKLTGTNEVVSVKMDDGSTENRNAGRTIHQGIEFSISAEPVKDLTIRLNGAYSQHKFGSFIEKGNDYSGREMNGAPRWIHNLEAWYKPGFAKFYGSIEYREIPGI
jgi:outer membrane receptor protein involved in Fe transport